MKSKNEGFSLLEVLLTIAVLAVIAGFSTPLYLGLQVRNDLDVAATTVVQVLRRAQTLSQAADGDDTWGTYIQQGSATLFKGATWASRDTAYDDVNAFSSSISISGPSTFVFSKFKGEPIATGSTTLTSTTNETRTVTINSKGLITL